MPALMLNRSSRVMPGLRGTPGRDDDEVGAGEGGGELVGAGVAGDLDFVFLFWVEEKRSGLSFFFFFLRSAAPRRICFSRPSFFFSNGCDCFERCFRVENASSCSCPFAQSSSRSRNRRP